MVRIVFLNLEEEKHFSNLAGTSSDYASAEDALVTDPLAENFLNFWNGRARINTEAFRKVFHPVPDDSVRTWKDYEQFHERYFHNSCEVASGKGKSAFSQYRWGHVRSPYQG